MSAKKQTLTPNQRTAASIDMTTHFLNSYYSEWRLVKILGIKKMLDNKYSFFDTVTLEVEGNNNGASIAQEITNGLYFDAVSECVQYIEDLFALINASKRPDYFIHDIITYSAGKITNQIKSFKPNVLVLSNAFHIPSDLVYKDEVAQQSYLNAIEQLKLLIESIQLFFIEYEFFFIQYKHGLTVALRPFGNKYDQEQIEKEKKGELKSMLAAYDNSNLQMAQKRNTFNISDGVMMPGFTENVRAVISKLHDENNYLRFVFPSNKELNIEGLVDMGKKIQMCITVFIFNYYHKLTDSHDLRKVQLPKDNKSSEILQFSYQSTP
ncbi:MAG: hypothetical protein WDO19_20115 [Bacteroidota bacterium]